MKQKSLTLPEGFPAEYLTWTATEKASFTREFTAKTTNDILKFLFECGVYSFRLNTMGVPIPGTGHFRSAPKTGLPDILAILPPHGQFYGIEVKTGKDRLSDAQIGTHSNVRRMGGEVLVVKDFADFKMQWASRIKSSSGVV